MKYSDLSSAAKMHFATKQDGVIIDAFFCDNALYMTDRNGVSMLLSNHGSLGWRLRTANTDGEFEEKGAAQGLASFLGEPVNDPICPVTVSQEGSVMIMRASDGTTATVSLGENFSIVFATAKGSITSEVTGVALTDDGIKLMGALADGEHVWGGGQRFDSIDHRGQEMMIFSFDAYDTAKGKATYLAIPFFTTSRGGGFFMNRYERMNVDLGSQVSDAWSIDLCCGIVDCYFYATEQLTDALRSYTALTGHAGCEPTDWVQGFLICRYSPDNRTFDQDLPIVTDVHDLVDFENCSLYLPNMAYGENLSLQENLDKISEGSYILNRQGRKCYVFHDEKFYPTTKKGGLAGRSVKTGIERLRAVGQRPTGAVVEGYAWMESTFDSEKGEAKRHDMERMMQWLEQEQLHCMVYMAVGNLNKNMKGYKPEYQVQVKLTDKDGNVTVTDQIFQQSFTSNPDCNLKACRNYLDITNPEAVDWYMNEIWGRLFDLGVRGAKIDFCEMMPDPIDYFKKDEDGNITDGFHLEYKFHDPSVFNGMDVHHAYPTYFISLFCKRMNEKLAAMGSKDGFFALSRGGGIGSQRNPYLWAGDQTRHFDRLLPQLTASLTSGISGVPFMTYDMGGYGYRPAGIYFNYGMKDLESRIYIRAVEYTAFTTCMQTHGDVRTLNEMNEEAQTISALYEDLHKALIPFTRKYFTLASNEGIPVIRPLALNYQDDENAWKTEDAFLLGDTLLVAPIYTDHTFSREVYLPKGNWKNLLTGEMIIGGQCITADASLAQIPVFLNLNAADAEDAEKIFACEAWRTIQKM